MDAVALNQTCVVCLHVVLALRPCWLHERRRRSSAIWSPARHWAGVVGVVNMDKLIFRRDGRIACLCVRAVRPFRRNVRSCGISRRNEIIISNKLFANACYLYGASNIIG